MLFNYKKTVDKRGLPEWHYKIHSIARFASELSELKFPPWSILIPAPTSNRRCSKDFDSRIEDSILKLKEIRSDLLFQPILDMKQSVPSAHARGGSRNPFDIKQQVLVDSFSIEVPKIVFLIDDMITTGGHFRAFKDALTEKYPGLKVIGIFWAKHVFSD
jgi:predicted amidophosphoribosyltransferase